jgi:hypothetical protein
MRIMKIMPGIANILFPQSQFAAAFSKAVTDARLDYPEETKNVTFIDMSAPGAVRKILHSFLNACPNPAYIAEKSALLRYISEKIMAREIKKYFLSQPALCLPMQIAPLLMVHSSPKNRLFPSLDDSQHTFIAFTHELGHLVTENTPKLSRHAFNETASANEERNESEIAADTFAMLLGLRKGVLTEAVIERYSLDRAVHAWACGNWEHLTTLALDKLILSPDHTNFISLTPAEIKSVAECHAREFKMNNPQLKDLGLRLEVASSLRGSSHYAQYELARLADACRGSKDDSPEFYVAARILRAALDDKKLHIPGEKKPLRLSLDGKYWDDLRRELCIRARRSGAEKMLAPRLPCPSAAVRNI